MSIQLNCIRNPALAGVSFGFHCSDGVRCSYRRSPVLLQQRKLRFGQNLTINYRYGGIGDNNYRYGGIGDKEVPNTKKSKSISRSKTPAAAVSKHKVTLRGALWLNSGGTASLHRCSFLVPGTRKPPANYPGKKHRPARTTLSLLIAIVRTEFPKRHHVSGRTDQNVLQ